MLSVAILARDEERHISLALQSVTDLADEILVLVDARTTDQTAAIGHEHGARVVVEPWRGFSGQRNLALSLCRNDWVLFLDADERVTDELARDMRAVVSHSSPAEDRPRQPAGYWIPRHNQFFGRTLRGGGWYPDRQLRLLDRRRAHYSEARLVHEYPVLDGQAGELQGHLLHLNAERLGELWRKQSDYALAEAQTLYLGGRRTRWRNFVGAPAREFYRRFVALGGYRDGALGLFLCGTLAYFEVVKYAHLKGLERL